MPPAADKLQQRLELEIQLDKENFHKAIKAQRRHHWIGFWCRLNRIPDDYLGIRFPSHRSFNEFSTVTGAGSHCIQSMPKPIAFLHYEAADHALSYCKGTAVAFTRWNRP